MHFTIENDQTILLTMAKDDLQNLLRNALIYEDTYLKKYRFMLKQNLEAQNQ